MMPPARPLRFRRDALDAAADAAAMLMMPPHAALPRRCHFFASAIDAD